MPTNTVHVRLQYGSDIIFEARDDERAAPERPTQSANKKKSKGKKKVVGESNLAEDV